MFPVVHIGSGVEGWRGGGERRWWALPPTPSAHLGNESREFETNTEGGQLGQRGLGSPRHGNF